MPEPAQLGGVAREEQLDVQSASRRELALEARHHRQVVGARQQPGGKPRHRMPSVVATAWPLAHVDEHARASCSGTAARGRCRARGDVLRHARPWRIACWRSAATGALRFWRRVGHGGGVADRPRRRRRPSTRIVRSTTMRPLASSGRPSCADDRVRPDAGRPHERAAWDHLAACESAHGGSAVDPSSVASRVRISMPRPRSSRLANSARSAVISRHDAVARLDEDPAHPLRAAARVEVDDVGGEVLQLGQALERRRSRAPTKTKVSHFCALARRPRASRPSRGAQQVVAQRDRVGQRLEARSRARPGRGSAACARPSPARR